MLFSEAAINLALKENPEGAFMHTPAGTWF